MNRNGSFVLAAVFATLLSALSALSATSARADPMTFYFENAAPNSIQIYLSDNTSGGGWPGNGNAYDLDKRGEQSITINCDVGHQICYGAWNTGNRNKYWGAGYFAKQRCDKCCYVCARNSEVRVPKFVVD